MDSQSNRGVEGNVRVRLVDRLSALVAHPKRLIVAIVALLVATGAAVGSSAVLTSSSTNPGNTFSAANLSVTNDVTGALISVPGMLPGQSSGPQPITITNNGDLPGRMTLTGIAASDTPGPNGGNLSSALNATIVDTDTATTIYDNGPAVTDPNAPIVLDGDPANGGADDPWQPGDEHHYTVQLTFQNGGPPSANNTGDNAFQQSSTTLRYDWKATQ